MKKQATILFLLLGITYTTFAQRIIKNPEYEFKSTGINTITQIERNKENTRIQIHSEFIPHWWITFDSTSYIKDADSGKKYFPIGIEGTTFGKQTFMPDSGDSIFTLVFPPLDKKMKKFDYMESETGEGSIFGVSLEKKKKQKTKQTKEGIYGTWKDMENHLATEADPSVNYGSNFFRKDTAHLRGFLKGYDSRAGFNTGIIYINNVMTREDYPTVVQIHPDGRFEADFPLNQPWEGYIFFKRTTVPFYIEPGETLFISLDWEDFLMADRYRDRRYEFKNIVYKGTSARINAELCRIKVNTFSYRDFEKQLKTLSPADFKQQQLEALQEANDSLALKLKQNSTSIKGQHILKNKILLSFYGALFDYAMMRTHYAARDSTNEILKQPLPDDYYDFLTKINSNDKNLMIPNSFSSFINRYEFMGPFNKANIPFKPEDRFEVLSKEWIRKDSILRNDLQITPGLLFDIAKVRSLDYALSSITPKEGTLLVGQLTSSIAEPFLKEETMRMYAKKFPEGEKQAYKLPEGKATDIFRKMVNPHKGKFVLVDFWATTCGPCIYSIKEMQPLRDKYKGSPDLAFVYITDTGGSPESSYNKFISENDMGDNLFRLSEDEYNYLRQLFRFNGIPRYVMLNRDGDVIDDDFPGHSAKTELQKLLPDSK